MVYNVKNVVGLIQKTFSLFCAVPDCAVPDCAVSGLGDYKEKHFRYNEFSGMPTDDWQIRFGVKGR
jgi:hypothetical protein